MQHGGWEGKGEEEGARVEVNGKSHQSGNRIDQLGERRRERTFAHGLAELLIVRLDLMKLEDVLEELRRMLAESPPMVCWAFGPSAVWEGVRRGCLREMRRLGPHQKLADTGSGEAHGGCQIQWWTKCLGSKSGALTCAANKHRECETYQGIDICIPGNHLDDSLAVLLTSVL